MSQNQKILDRLIAAGDKGATTSELFAGLYCTKYTSRISELRKKGHDIRGTRIKGSAQWRYVVLPSFELVSQ